MDIPIITNVVIESGRVIFTRRVLSVPTEYESILNVSNDVTTTTLYLDKSKQPNFSPHPAGGWVSPPYEQIREAEVAGIEIEDINHIRCKCHKSADDSDAASLEAHGHTASCPKLIQLIPPPPAPAYFPDPAAYHQPPQAAPPVPHQAPPPPPPSIKGGPIAAALAGMDNIPYLRVPTNIPGYENYKPAPKPVPPGGLPGDRLQMLMASLAGSTTPEGSPVTLMTGLSEINVDMSKHSAEVIATQLYRDMSFSKCGGCHQWAEVGASGRCSGCEG